MPSTTSKTLPIFPPAFTESPLAASVSPSKIGQERQLASLLTGTVSSYFELVNKLKRQAMQPSIAAAPQAPRIAARKIGAELATKTAFAASFPLPADAPVTRMLSPSQQLAAATALAATIPLPADASLARKLTLSQELAAATVFAAAVALPADAPVVRKLTLSQKLTAATAFAAAVPLPADAPVARKLTSSQKHAAATAFAAAVPLPAESDRKVRFADPVLVSPSNEFFSSPSSVASFGTNEPTKLLPEINASREAPSYLQALRAAASRLSGAVAGALVGAWGTTTAAAGQLTTDVVDAIGAVVRSVAVLFARAQNVATRTFGVQRSDLKKA